VPDIDRATSDRLGSPERLTDLDESGLLDAAASAALDALTQAARAALGTDITALVNVVTADRQVTVSISTDRETPDPKPTVSLSHSMCKNVVLSGEPYLVDNAADDARHALAVRDFGVGAYVGFPLHGTRGTVLGAVCAVVPSPRHWTATDLDILGSLTAAAEAVVAMHTAARHARMARLSGPVPTDPTARMQHIVRTPLTSLIGYLDLLSDGTLGELNGAQLNALRRCQTNADRLHEAVVAADQRPESADLARQAS
jgi:hypothetical protein